MLPLLNPTHPGVLVALITALLLGLVHGIVPDEHTWPITFSYSVGSYSTRRGLFAGLLFSLSFTIQRAIACELAWFGLSHWMQNDWLNRLLLIPIGLLMAWGGWMMHYKQFHSTLNAPYWARFTTSMPAIHGFIAGWGFGAFALILYTTLAPAMPSAAWGWLPGALFGLGTTLIQAFAGAGFGYLAASRHLSAQSLRTLALFTASRTLRWGGLAYVLAGCFSLIFPALARWKLSTGIHFLGFDQFDLPLIIAIVCVMGVGLGSFFFKLHQLAREAVNSSTSDVRI